MKKKGKYVKYNLQIVVHWWALVLKSKRKIENLPDSEAVCGVEPRTVGTVESFGKLGEV